MEKNNQVLILPAGGSREPASIKSVTSNKHYINMDGKEVFKFAVRIMEKSSLSALEKANIAIDDLDFLVPPHQANIRIIDAARKKIKSTYR